MTSLCLYHLEEYSLHIADYNHWVSSPSWATWWWPGPCWSPPCWCGCRTRQSSSSAAGLRSSENDKYLNRLNSWIAMTHLVDLVTIEGAHLPPLHISHQLLLCVPVNITSLIMYYYVLALCFEQIIISHLLTCFSWAAWETPGLSRQAWVAQLPGWRTSSRSPAKIR